MENVPEYLPIFFGLTVVLSIWIFYKATNYSKWFLLTMLIWAAIQITLSVSGFYWSNDTMPPRFQLMVLPAIVVLIILFTTTKGKAFIDELDLKSLTLFSLIRIPVEIVLFGLFTYKAIPELMTFEGRNFDIFSGLSAPVIYYLVFVKGKFGRIALLVWNVACLGLLLNVVFYALLSIPSVFQHFAFDQPNVAVTYFPFVLLPSCLVPLVMLSHFASIRIIVTTARTQNRPVSD
ncbi:MAG: hypothetical protein EOO51_09110 [Flavobacterium sp.]|nr:MAG: hypothetical protein EOO51_09110 [Flavobacterium sp.]